MNKTAGRSYLEMCGPLMGLLQQVFAAVLTSLYTYFDIFDIRTLGVFYFEETKSASLLHESISRGSIGSLEEPIANLRRKANSLPYVRATMERPISRLLSDFNHRCARSCLVP